MLKDIQQKKKDKTLNLNLTMKGKVGWRKKGFWSPAASAAAQLRNNASAGVAVPVADYQSR